MRYTKTYYDACKIQKRMMQSLEGMEPRDLANIAKGYVCLEQMKLRLRGKGPIKAIDPTPDHNSASGVAKIIG